MQKSHLIADDRHDPYQLRAKLPQPTLCPRCGAVFANGRWQWVAVAPRGAPETVCPACQRIADRYPAGEVTLAGQFVAAHRDEIVNLLRNLEAAQQAEHPLQRIVALEEGRGKEGHGGRIVVTTTDIHLPRRMGHALTDAYAGDLTTHYDEDGYFVRMTLTRDD
jgi:hypothetical protein